MKKLHSVRTLKNDPAEIISVSTAVLGRMHREVIFTRHSIAIIIHFSLETEKKIIRTTDTYLCLSVSSLWTNLASSRMCDWNRNSLPLFGGRSKLYHQCYMLKVAFLLASSILLIFIVYPQLQGNLQTRVTWEYLFAYRKIVYQQIFVRHGFLNAVYLLRFPSVGPKLIKWLRPKGLMACSEAEKCAEFKNPLEI